MVRARLADNKVQWYCEKQYKNPDTGAMEWKIVKVYYSEEKAVKAIG